jgi:hypothetical protein
MGFEDINVTFLKLLVWDGFHEVASTNWTPELLSNNKTHETNCVTTHRTCFCGSALFPAEVAFNIDGSFNFLHKLNIYSKTQILRN